jgi:glycosyltransferase involved in cell wall biosynthesis
VNFSGAKLVLYIHTIGFTEISKNSRLNRRFIEGIFSSSVKIVTLGETMKNDLTLFNMLSKTVVIKNTSRHNFNSSLKNGLSHQKLEAPDVLFLSNLLPKKGILDFLQVASITLKSLPDLKFSVIGSTSSPKFMSYIEEELVRLDLVDKIKFIGEQSGDEKWHLLEEAQVLLFPSHYQEAQPLTIIEAMSVSTPTIAYDNGGIKDLVLNGINGVLVPSNDVEVMSRELIELMSDPNKLFFLSSNSRKFYETHHACLHYSNAWKSLLENLSAGPSPDTI